MGNRAGASWSLIGLRCSGGFRKQGGPLTGRPELEELQQRQATDGLVPGRGSPFLLGGWAYERGPREDARSTYLNIVTSASATSTSDVHGC